MRKNFFRKAASFTILAFICLLGSIQCGKAEKGGDGGIDVSGILFSLPTQIEAEPAGLVTFRVLQEKAPQQTDEFLFGSTVCQIESVSVKEFNVRLPQNLMGGKYEVAIRRGQKKKSFGETILTIKSKTDPDFTPDKGTTVWGHVLCEGAGVSGVVVSDGVQVTKTDSDGLYQLKSAKKWGYVFISVPSGYEVPSQGVLPQFYNYLTASSSQVEQKDFVLTKVTGQDKYKMFFLGDMHLADRTNDKAQFRVFTSDLTAYMASHSSEKMYGMTLGDMTWDIYWYDNKYSFPEYLDEINGGVKNLQIFHTMGNHDNDYKIKAPNADFLAASGYVKNLGPTYYSFNIGKIHYVVLDDIDCANYDGTTSRNYSRDVTSEQLDWLEKDLAYVDKSTPLIVTTHAQVFGPNSVDNFKVSLGGDTARLFRLLSGYKVHFVTGHTHVIYNVNPKESSLWMADLYEHNAGSVCGSWWWSGKLTSGVYVGTDGSPAGYSIWDIDGTDIKWRYKATAWDESYQFRSYDLNGVSFSYNDVPNMPLGNTELTDNGFGLYVKAYPENSDNEVLINIWNWNSNWTLDVTDESGKKLDWTATSAYDPLHIAALSVKRYNNAGLTSRPNFVTEKWHHFFKVTAPDADTDLTIKVTDEFGNVYTEKMERPKVFRVEDYSRK